MKFCDKLPKLRKNNNLSQEQLADRLGVSRQAVSKWESGQSHPDMEKMNEMCKILNCTLEDLLDDGTINKERTSHTKTNFTNYANDFLKFITKMYNMFCSMTFKEKIKCLLEMTFIGFLLFFAGCIIFAIIDSAILTLFNNIPKVGYYINYLFSNLLYIILIAIGLVVFIHLFKIRYLDYYVTIEDQNVTEKKIEEPFDKKEYKNERKEKIIIRDPEHSKLSFFDFLTNIVIIIIKIGFIFIAIPCIILFISITVFLFIGIFNLNYGIFFLFASIALIGLLLINYVILEFIYKFIVSKKQAFLKIFFIFIGGLLLVGAGIGLASATYLEFDKQEQIPSELKEQKTEIIKMKDNLVLLDSSNIKYIIDNNQKNIKVQTNYNFITLDIYNITGPKQFDIWTIDSNTDINHLYKIIYNDIKQKQTRNYGEDFYLPAEVTLSKENYNTIIKNNKKFHQIEMQYE